MDFDAAANTTRIGARVKHSQFRLQQIGRRNGIVVNVRDDRGSSRGKTRITSLRKPAARTIQITDVRPALRNGTCVIGRSVVHQHDFIFGSGQGLSARGSQAPGQNVGALVSANDQ
jgi:hypothetical protein